jgi:hypothetical protein
MKKTSRSSTGRVAVVLGMTAIAGLAGCELLVDFDRSLIDAGLGDASFTDGASADGSNDVTLTDTSPGPDSAQDSANDSPVSETGADGGDGSTGDDSGDGATTTDASDAGVDAADGNVADAADAADTAPTPAALTIAPLTQDFMMVDAGTSSAPILFTVTNSGGTDAAGVAASVVSVLYAADFLITNDTCNGTPVPANGGTCTLDVTFTPSAVSGTVETGTLTVTTTSGTPGTSALTGTAN